jgi:hypothetical protein
MRDFRDPLADNSDVETPRERWWKRKDALLRFARHPTFPTLFQRLRRRPFSGDEEKVGGPLATQAPLPRVERPTTEKLALHLQKTGEPTEKAAVVNKRTVSFLEDETDSIRQDHTPDAAARSSRAQSLADESTVVGVANGSRSAVDGLEPVEEAANSPGSKRLSVINRYVAGALGFASHFKVPSTIVMSRSLFLVRMSHRG